MSVLITAKIPADVDIFTKSVQERGEDFTAVAERGKAAGAIHHQFGVGPDYVLVIDEWDSAEHFEAFFTAPDLQQFVAEVGGDTSVPPEITVATSIDSADRF